MRHRLTIMLLLTLAIAPAIHAQTLDETKTWIVEKLRNDATFTEEGRNLRTTGAVAAAYFDGCLLKFTATATNSKDDVKIGKLSQAFTVPMADATAGVRNIKGNTYLVLSTGDAKKIKLTMTIAAAGINTTESVIETSEAQVRLTDEAMAERLAKALNHAAALCKQKKEPF